MTSPLADDEMTELVDADFPRVDLVGKGANGVSRFLIAKQDEGSRGLVPPDMIRDLIGKETAPEPLPEVEHVLDGSVTMSGSPAAMAAFIHKAAVRAAQNGDPVPADDVAKVGIGPELDGDADAHDGMDLTTPLAEATDTAPGDPTSPASPAWEAIDAATAQKWTSIAVRLRNALGVLADREMQEAASADPGDAGNAWDLQDAQCAVDFVIDTLAGFAVDEQAATDLGTEALATIGKAMATFNTGSLDVIEGLTAIRKSGRVLSSANETRIRDAAASLQSVLASLPAAPQAPDSGQPVAKTKETAMADTSTQAEPVAETVEKAEETTPETVAADLIIPAVTSAATGVTEVVKADDGGDGKPSMRAVFDANGNLVGIVDPSAITPVSGASAAPAEAATEPEPEPAAETDPADLTPAPAADAGTPADATDDEVAKADDTAPDDKQDIAAQVAKSATEAIQAALSAREAAHEETVAKQAAVIEDMAGQIAVLKGRVEEIAEQPAQPRVFTNGATPPPGALRGQDQGTSAPVDVAKAQELKQTLYRGTAAEQNEAFNEMQRMAVGQLAAMHAQR